MNLNWLLRVSTKNLWIITLLFPPVYPLWVYKIGKESSTQLGKKSFFFSAICIFLSLGWIVVPYLHAFHPEYFSEKLILALILAHYYVAYYSSRMSILYEFKEEEDMPTITDYLHRFGQIWLWPLGVWVLQPKLNKMFSGILWSAHNTT